MDMITSRAPRADEAPGRADVATRAVEEADLTVVQRLTEAEATAATVPLRLHKPLGPR